MSNTVNNFSSCSQHRKARLCNSYKKHAAISGLLYSIKNHVLEMKRFMAIYGIKYYSAGVRMEESDLKI